MSAADDARQLAAQAQHCITGTDSDNLADRLDAWADWSRTNNNETPRSSDLRAAARIVRHHQQLLTAIGDPDELRGLARILRSFGATLWADHIARIADAADTRDTA